MTNVDRIIEILQHNKERINGLVIGISALPGQQLFCAEEDPLTSKEGGDQMIIALDSQRDTSPDRLGQMVTPETRGLALIIHEDIGVSRRETKNSSHTEQLLRMLAGARNGN